MDTKEFLHHILSARGKLLTGLRLGMETVSGISAGVTVVMTERDRNYPNNGHIQLLGRSTGMDGLFFSQMIIPMFIQP